MNKTGINKENLIPYALIKAEVNRLGFSAFGTAPAEEVADFHKQYQNLWTEAGYAAEMHYLERNTAVRYDPRLLLEGAQTIISLALSYAPPFNEREETNDRWCLAWYARGEDYHRVMKRKLETLLKNLQKSVTESDSRHPLEGRTFCDTAPLMERYWAWRCGIGWIGRNHQLIIPRQGSAFFLGELVINMKVDQYDRPFEKNFCGNCTKCIEACPTGALNNTYGLDARKCLSYLTIEHRGPIPGKEASKMYPCFYGCDRCQAVCPHMKHAEPTQISEFKERSEIKNMTTDKWRTLDESQYQELFRHSAVKRVKFEGLLRNIKAMEDHHNTHNSSDQ